LLLGERGVDLGGGVEEVLERLVEPVEGVAPVAVAGAGEALGVLQVYRVESVVKVGLAVRLDVLQ